MLFISLWELTSLIYAYDYINVQDPNLNTNTNFITVNFHQARDKPAVHIAEKISVTTKVVDLHRKWAERMGYNINSFELVHNENELERSGTVKERGLRNGCELFIVRKQGKSTSVSTSTSTFPNWWD